VQGSQQYKFHCCLSAFVKDANSFTSTLSQYVNEPHRFADELSKKTNGFITNESIHEAQTKQSQKRSRGKTPLTYPLLCCILGDVHV